MRRAAFITLLIALPALALAYTSPGKPSGFLNDFAGVLSAQDKSTLEGKLAAYTKQSGNEIAVVTVPSLGGDTVENYAVKLFEEWGIGKKGKDNGVLLLFAMQDRAVRIEVGYGLEPYLTDLQSSWIIQNQIVPAFKDGNYAAGMNAAVDKVIGVLSGSETIPSEPASRNLPSGIRFGDWFALVFFVPIWLASILSRSKSWWAGGVIGGVVGVILGFVYGFLYTGIIWIALLIPVGLLFDWAVSRKYAQNRAAGIPIPWWMGGRGRGGSGWGGGGFGGFGGGSSGGGGASGRW